MKFAGEDELRCISTGLLESELSGFERGALTGVIAKRVERFEPANRGAVFLEGEIPHEVQVKLAGVLQDGEIERLGSTRTIRTDAYRTSAIARVPTPPSGAGCSRNSIRPREYTLRNDFYFYLRVISLDRVRFERVVFGSAGAEPGERSESRTELRRLRTYTSRFVPSVLRKLYDSVPVSMRWA